MEYIRRAIFYTQMTLRQIGDDQELYEVLDKLIEIEKRLTSNVKWLITVH